MRTLLSIASLLAAGAAPAAASTITVLDPGATVGSPSVVIGTDGLGLIAYVDGAGMLKVAHCSNAACTAATLTTLDTIGPTVGFVSLAIGSDGRGVIAYYDTAPQPALRVAHCDDVACTSATSTTIQSGRVRGRTAMVVGADGRPLVVYPIDTPLPPRLMAAHCADAACSSASTTVLASLTPSTGNYDAAAVIGSDGRPLIAYVGLPSGQPPLPPPAVIHCADAACTQPMVRHPVTPSATGRTVFGASFEFMRWPSLTIGADGRALLSYSRYEFAPVTSEYRLRHCADAACSTFDSDVSLPLTGAQAYSSALTPGTDGKPWLVWSRNGRIRHAQCEDASCATRTESCAPVPASEVSLARGTDGIALAAAGATAPSGLRIVHGFDPCVPSVAGAADASTPENGTVPFVDVPVTLDQPADAEGTIDYTTVDGTALAGVDYIAASGTLTFYPGGTTPGFPGNPRIVLVGDALDEPDEHFSLVLSNPQGGVLLGDATADVTIVDDDDPSLVTTGDCAAPEGDATGGTCTVPLAVSPASGHTVTVAYTTADGTATAGTDYAAASGTVTFAPGETQKTVPVALIGDTAVEPDETFRLVMAAPANAVLFNATGQGAIVDDDFASLSTLEVTHGTRLVADLADAAGVDLYRLAQPALTSWEVMVDAASGDAVPGLTLERLAADGSTVLQTGDAVGTGAAVALRFSNRFAAPVVSQHLRVRSTGCGTGCDAGDTYRLRVFDTTARLARFNNSGTQRTVLLLQNATDAPVDTSVDFWNAGGERLAAVGVALGPRGLSVVDTSTIAPVAGASGSITITSDAPYGGLSGKAVALDLFTFFALDTPLEYRPR
jgi:hypothetical protein